jgi:hypothetical protein
MIQIQRAEVARGPGNQNWKARMRK